MKFVMNHCNVNVRDLEKSVKFYQESVRPGNRAHA